jgi:hypothetical protein
VSEPDLELSPRCQERRDDAVHFARVESEAAHDCTVNAEPRPVIGRLADPQAPKDQLTG